MFVRPAGIQDAEAIALVHVRTWRIAYAELVPAAYLANITLERRAPRWREILSSDTGDRTLVAEDSGNLIGFATYGANQDGLDPEIGELLALYVDPDAWDRG